MNSVVQTIVNQLKSYKPERIILFGSYASGKSSPDSDVDIAIIKKTADSFHERQKETRMLLKTTTPVDIFVFTPEEFEKARQDNLFVQEIAKMGKVIYG